MPLALSMRHGFGTILPQRAWLMVTRWPLFAAIILSAAAGRGSDEVDVWMTIVADGDAKAAALGRWDDDQHYGADQDLNFTLFRKMPPVALQKRGSGQRWRIVLNPDHPFQTIKGLGGAMTDSSAYVLQELKKHNRPLYEYSVQRLFSPDQGAGFSYLRRPIGSSDYTATKSNYTYADEPSEDLSSFSIDHDQVYIIPTVREAIRVNPEIEIMGTPWSAPAWMKTNGRLGGITAQEKAAGRTNRLKPEYFDLYAEYFVKYIQAYAAEGIAINAVTLQNEPQFDTAAYPCMRMTAQDQIELVKRLGRRFQQEKIATEIFVHDHNWQLHPDDRRTAAGDTKMDPVELVTQIMSDLEAGPYVAGSAWHCYSGGTAEMAYAYHTIFQRFPAKSVYCTELSGWGKNRGAWYGDVQWGLTHNWLGGLANGASVALEWNIALDHKFGPTLREDSAALGLITVNTDTWKDVKFEREFYGMAHVSRAARPGSRHLETIILHNGELASNGPLTAVGFSLPDGRYSLVVLNDWNSRGAFEVACGETRFDYSLPGKSLATFVWGH